MAHRGEPGRIRVAIGGWSYAPWRGAPKDLPRIDAAHEPDSKPRDVFVHFIHEGKLRAPAAAMALIERLGARL